MSSQLTFLNHNRGEQERDLKKRVKRQWGDTVGFGAKHCGQFCCRKFIPKVGPVIDFGFLPLSLTFCSS